MDSGTIAELLTPFLRGSAHRPEKSVPLSEIQLGQLSVYLDLLLLWNDKVNLTAIRDAESIVRRHFGESLFLGRWLFPAGCEPPVRLIDFGSGAGFPGVPIKIWAPALQLSLLESNQKKATFLSDSPGDGGQRRRLGFRSVSLSWHSAMALENGSVP